jgi:DNA-binding MarR family transcriptional regulator
MKNLIYEIIAAAGTIDAAGIRVFKPLGLTPMTFNILTVLTDGPLSQREISDRMIVAASSITFQVKQLQKKGLIQRRRSDARTWNVFLTPLGAEKQRLAEQRMDQIIDQIPLDIIMVRYAESVLKTIQAHLPQLIEGKNKL